MRVWVLYRGNELDNADNFGVFSSDIKAKKALKMFAEFEDDLHIESFIVDKLEELYPKVKEKTRSYHLYNHRTFVNADLSFRHEWKITPPNLDVFIYHANDEEKNFMYRNEWAVYATIYAKSEDDAKKIADEMIEKLGDEDYIYA